jgi:hypothetical protein
MFSQGDIRPGEMAPLPCDAAGLRNHDMQMDWMDITSEHPVFDASYLFDLAGSGDFILDYA